MSDIRRTRSLMVLPSYTPRDYTYGALSTYRVSTSPALYNVRRALSYPNLYSSTYSYLPEYRPSFYRYYRDWDLRDDYWYDRRYYTSYRYWPYYGSPYRRYYSTSLDYYPYTTSYSYSSYRPGYFSSYYDYDRPRYLSGYYYDYLNSWYWKRRLDPYAYRPYSYSSLYSRPWSYESSETDRAWDMYRKGMIGYDTFDRYYLSPSTWNNRYSDYLKPYRPPISYSSYPHYLYSSDYR